MEVLDPMADLGDSVEVVAQEQATTEELATAVALNPESEVEQAFRVVQEIELPPAPADDAPDLSALPEDTSGLTAADVFEEVPVGITEVEASPQGTTVPPQPLTPEAADSATSEVAERAVDDPEADVRRTGLEPEEGLDLGEQDPANPHGRPMPPASAGAELSALGSVGFFARLWGMVRGLGQRESRRSSK